jgi:hypothetical protein
MVAAQRETEEFIASSFGSWDPDTDHPDHPDQTDQPGHPGQPDHPDQPAGGYGDGNRNGAPQQPTLDDPVVLGSPRPPA